MTNITTRNNKIQTTDNKIQARDRSFKPFGVYRNAVLSLNSTQIASDVNTRLLYKWLIDNNLYDDLVLAVGGEYGIQKNYVDPNWQVENAYDLSKFGNNAGQATAADQPIITANNWLFDGSRFLNCGNDNSLDLKPDEPWCISYWEHPIINTGYTITKGTTSATTTHQLSIHQNPDLRVTIGGLRIDSGHILTKQWHYINFMNHNLGGVWHLQLFVDNTLVATRSSGTAVSPDIDMLIGARRDIDNTGAGFLYQGMLNDMTIFPTILTEAERISLYNLQKGKYGY